MIPEIHHLTRFQSLQSWGLAVLAVIALLAVYALVQYHDDNVKQRAEINAFKSRGCPSSWRGKPFIFSAEEQVNVLRPGTVSLACYYKAAVQS